VNEHSNIAAAARRKKYQGLTMIMHEEFHLKRVYALGWKAASQQRVPAARRLQRMINPYLFEPERTRWDEGFADARKPRMEVRS
jgi:hypothetical protein